MAFLYFDTDAYRNLATAFASAELPEILKKRIFLSPITTVELLTQLTTGKAAEVLKQIRALRNIMDPQQAPVLPHPSAAIAMYGFSITYDDKNFTESLAGAVNACLQANSASEVGNVAGKLKDLLEKDKKCSVENFLRLLESFRKEPLASEETLKELFVEGLARRVGATPSRHSVQKIVNIFSAYYEFEKEKLRIAKTDFKYKPENHSNDLFDAEQLIYLGNPRLLHFVTCDRGFKRGVTQSQSSQRDRIHVINRADISDMNSAICLIQQVTA